MSKTCINLKSFSKIDCFMIVRCCAKMERKSYKPAFFFVNLICHVHSFLSAVSQSFELSVNEISGGTHAFVDKH